MFNFSSSNKNIQPKTSDKPPKNSDKPYNQPSKSSSSKIYSIVPLNIFQTWHTVNLPVNMKKNVALLKEQNPEFNYYLYDDDMCREFIKNNFDEEVVYTFDKLMPGAYKSDLWRCCVLYIYGGIYLDIKYKCVNGFKLINLTKQEHFARDRLHDGLVGIYQAMLVCMPNNYILYKSIKLIIENVKNNVYGHCALSPCGPHMMTTFFNDITREQLLLAMSKCGLYITYDNKNALCYYDEYRKEMENTEIKGMKYNHYSTLWNKRTIYNYPILTSFKTHNYTKTIKLLIVGKKETFYSSTPSIVEISNSSYLINIRWVNYKYETDGPYILPDNIISVNSKFTVDLNFNQITDEIFLEEPISEKNIRGIGLEDIRIFNAGKLSYYIASSFDDNLSIYTTVSDVYDASTDTYEVLRSVILPDNYDISSNITDEKNWSFVNYKSELCVVYKWFPLQIGQIDYDTNKMNIIKIKYNIPEYFKTARGSTPGYTFKNEIWFVLHKRLLTANKSRNYQHFFAIFDLDMNLVRYSELFSFTGNAVEYCTGLIIKDETIILSHSISDIRSIISEYNFDYINNDIQWYKIEKHDNEYIVPIDRNILKETSISTVSDVTTAAMTAAMTAAVTASVTASVSAAVSAAVSAISNKDKT